jgi:hypothetical protein
MKDLDTFDPEFVKEMDRAARGSFPCCLVAKQEDQWVVTIDREIIFMNGDQEVFILPPMTEIYLKEGLPVINIGIPPAAIGPKKPLGSTKDFKAYLLAAKEEVEERMMGKADPMKEC